MRAWRPLAIAASLVLASAGCTIDVSPNESSLKPGEIVIQGTVWHTADPCSAGLGHVLDGSSLVLADASGSFTHTADFGGPAPEGADNLVPTSPECVVTSTYWVKVPKVDSYRVSFVPGSSYGKRPFPSTQIMSFQQLDAANSWLDYDTGNDGVSPSVVGKGIVLGPKVCAGFPAPGCAP